ncbi:MAG TPA: mechanosensitive ion channel domain-containing protein [Longimicrobiaceae bacterium]|nr:mechanosensitive ion channel domain-containing protein [Longimicrobiaceae bacterium]
MARPYDPRYRRDLRRTTTSRTQTTRRGVRTTRAPLTRGRRGPARDVGSVAAGARARLRGFRKASIVAVAITAFFLMIFAPEEGDGAAQEPVAQDTPAVVLEEIPDTVAIIRQVPVEELQRAEAEAAAQEEEASPDTLARVATEDAMRALRGLWVGFLGNLPKYLVAIGILIIAGVLVRLLRPALRRVLRGWERSNAAVALVGFAIWLLALGIAISVLVGDIRALVGSLGLVGLALSWALQTPIESFTGWLMNSFQGYYRVGDRVAVGDAFGDVYRIDFLTTTVWEIGGPDRGSFVQAEQPTGRLITFPNYEVLRGSIVNLTRDFPFVWDELTVSVANKSDLRYAVDVLQALARSVLGEQMASPVQRYEEILRRERLEIAIAHEPQVFVSLDDFWTNLTIRYLVAARERRKWKSQLALAATEELNKPEHADRILSVFPRRQIQFIGPDGKAREIEWMLGEEERELRSGDGTRS